MGGTSAHQESYESMRSAYVRSFLLFFLSCALTIEVLVAAYISYLHNAVLFPFELDVSIAAFGVLLILTIKRIALRWIPLATMVAASAFLFYTLALPTSYELYVLGFVPIIPILALALLENPREIQMVLVLYLVGLVMLFIVNHDAFVARYPLPALVQYGAAAALLLVIVAKLRGLVLALRGALDRKINMQRKMLADQAFSAARAEAILKSIGDGIVVTDKRGKILFLNETAEKLLDMHAEKAVGKDISSVLRKEMEDGTKIPYKDDVLARVLAGDRFEADRDKRYYVVRLDGSRFPATMIVTPVILDGQVIGAVEMFRDITEEIEVDKAKTEFVSLASHQLRTPLSTVSWYAEMMMAGDAGKLTREQKGFLKEIYEGNQRMIHLVDALLNVSRIEAGTLSVKNEPVNIAAIIDDVLAEILPLMKDKRLQIHTSAPPDAAILLQADPDVIRVIVHNLITNAVKYTPDQGKISIGLERDLENVVLSVQDTGYGIPESQKPLIFSKLFRGDNVLDKVTDGTGLGLYMVKKLIDKLGGKIWFDSSEGKGSTFYVAWPKTGTREQHGTRTLIPESLATVR